MTSTEDKRRAAAPIPPGTWYGFGLSLIEEVRSRPLPKSSGGEALSHLCLLRCVHLLEQTLEASKSGLDELALLAIRSIIETGGYAVYYHMHPDQADRAVVSSDEQLQVVADLVGKEFQPMAVGSKGAVTWDQAWRPAIDKGRVTLGVDELRFWYKAASQVAMHGGLTAVERYSSREMQVIATPASPVGDATAIYETSTVFCGHAALAIGYDIGSLFPQVS